MNLVGKRVLITGASGGIGHALAECLLDEGAHVLVCARNTQRLRASVMLWNVGVDRADLIEADVVSLADRERLCGAASRWRGGVDILVNNAGVSDFGLLEDTSGESLERTVATNLLAPMDLCRRMLPHLRTRSEAQIVNIGSVFGSIGFAGNSAYCASKFGLRGFSEALRRELADTTVAVRYYAPRATRTSINSVAASAANAELGVTVDDPVDVAQRIVRRMQSSRAEDVFGWPEKFFARLNALLPRIVDRALAGQLPIVVKHARVRRANPGSQVHPFIERSRRVG